MPLVKSCCNLGRQSVAFGPKFYNSSLLRPHIVSPVRCPFACKKDAPSRSWLRSSPQPFFYGSAGTRRRGAVLRGSAATLTRAARGQSSKLRMTGALWLDGCVAGAARASDRCVEWMLYNVIPTFRSPLSRIFGTLFSANRRTDFALSLVPLVTPSTREDGGVFVLS